MQVWLLDTKASRAIITVLCLIPFPSKLPIAPAALSLHTPCHAELHKSFYTTQICPVRAAAVKHGRF